MLAILKTSVNIPQKATPVSIRTSSKEMFSFLSSPLTFVVTGLRDVIKHLKIYLQKY